MKRLTTHQLRQAYLDFFVSKGHKLFKSDSLVPANDPSVLFTSAGMNQFKDRFLGKVRDVKRATSCQKCFRTGDLEEVGRTPFHHTFFEMLGNFSFGDYFKKEAIQWAWEFVTEVMEIDPARLWASVYEDDDEAMGIWQKIVKVPADKIRKFGPKDNFWPSNAIKEGPNGPCGPCSEIYYEKEEGQSVEVWNLVFTQFNRCDGGILEPLPNKNIDTGMGLERMSSVLQGVDTNFKIDVFVPIVEAVRQNAQDAEDSAVYTVADHVRAVAFCIGDGVLPSNDGRGYVVRKLIRRCLYLTQASHHTKPFVYKLISSVAASMKEAYPEILERRDNIAQIVRAEEEKYIKNILEGGSEKLAVILESLKACGQKELAPETGLDLYVTYGIQPDFTKDYFEKAGIGVDMARIEALIRQEQDKSRMTSKMACSIFSGEGIVLKPSRFVGYETDTCPAKVVQIIKDVREVSEARAGDKVGIVLDQTPFYGEAGGQVGDTGEIRNEGVHGYVSDTKKQDGSIVHLVTISGESKGPLNVGDAVTARVDPIHREAVKRAHTATHILQAVLRQVLGVHVQQAGSFVEPDRFRFDFTHFKDISAEEMEDVQEKLNAYIIRNDKIDARTMSKSEAQKTGAIALFGEKYEDTVRVVSVGDYSKEFCGGTHAQETGRIGLVLITAESSVGSGLRRIEALTGKLAFNHLMDARRTLEEASEKLKTKPERLLSSLDAQAQKFKALEKDLIRLQEKTLGQDVEGMVGCAKHIKDVVVVEHAFKNADIAFLRRCADLLKAKIPQAGVFFLSGQKDEDIYFVCALTPALSRKEIAADALLKKILSAFDGSGGGRRDFAQGGLKDASKLEAVFKEFERTIREVL
ncbi:alanyl-tRNA synthetase [Candidatus Velamenicoccus archaeovorus]|uniref:Alanine--tRNA ligase n=1 Tax=Velamenicoccus archaeovorus TaxID=1930593 RepID=A0A410P4Z0_VELA1|nr:alanine--tRNA ligase [Candidatus Velamenicoccus archaeovorus]QAT17148.1 alanyl-tRNA synthetase [Candidatus Velamenicoccus archaeovorus]